MAEKILPGTPIRVILVFCFIVFSFVASAQQNISDDSLQTKNNKSIKDSTFEKKQEIIGELSISDSLELSERKKTKNKSYLPDTIFMKTGDKITGKIISFEQGRLKIDAQATGVSSVKWYKIYSVKGGNRIYKVEDVYGDTYIGRLGYSKDGEIKVSSKNTFTLKLENIVRMFPLETEWYRRFKGSLGAGLNYTKSSDVLTVNTEYNLYYVISKWRFINDFSFISTSANNEDASLRTQLNFQALYSLPGRWVLSEINSYSRNDELGVKSRISFGAGGGNDLIQTDWQRLLFLTGLVQNFEKDIETQQVYSFLEWPVALHHTVYKFMHPNITTTTSLSSFVGLTDKGRYRFDASADINWEFIDNFNLKLSFYYNYDNKPIAGKNTSKDYGTIISLLVDLK
jgi:hypothetical protein